MRYSVFEFLDELSLFLKPWWSAEHAVTTEEASL